MEDPQPDEPSHDPPHDPPHPPREIVLIRSPHGEAPPDPPPSLSAAVQRELMTLTGALSCDVRPRVLLYLAQHGPTCVGDLAAALAIDQKVLSGHLAKLKDKNLLDSTRQSRRVIYRLADGNVTYRRENGEAHLELSRGGGLKLTVTLTVAGDVPRTEPPPDRVAPAGSAD